MFYKKYDSKMHVIIAAAVIFCQITGWFADTQNSWTWIAFSIFAILLNVVLACGILYLLVVALLTIKRANC